MDLRAEDRLAVAGENGRWVAAGGRFGSDELVAGESGVALRWPP